VPLGGRPEDRIRELIRREPDAVVHQIDRSMNETESIPKIGTMTSCCLYSGVSD
jgi:hypothetical protein